MVSKREVTLPDSFIALCEQHGQRIVDGYSAGRNLGSRAVSSRGAEANPQLQAVAKMGEVAFCLWAGLDPVTSLDWSDYSDSGFDVLFHGAKVDVKHIAANRHFLIWPVNKRHFFIDSRANIFVLVRGNAPNFCVYKWITKTGFFCEKEVASDQTMLDPGTWFMRDTDLWEIDDLCALTKHAEAA